MKKKVNPKERDLDAAGLWRKFISLNFHLPCYNSRLNDLMAAYYDIC